MKEIPLTRGLVALVDDSDYDVLSSFKWRVSIHGYVVRTVGHPEAPTRKRHLPMHRFIMGLCFGDKFYVDHIDGNPLNNQRNNLRVCTPTQNQYNRKIGSNNKSGFKGVTVSESENRWRSQIKVNGKIIYLGTFLTPEAAHEAYCAAALKYHGEFANFGKAA